MNLNINYGETRRVGNNLIAKAEEYSNLINNIKNTNSEIASYWIGADATKYFQAVSEQEVYMHQLASVISEIGNYLIKVSNAYEDASANNANAINL